MEKEIKNSKSNQPAATPAATTTPPVSNSTATQSPPPKKNRKGCIVLVIIVVFIFFVSFFSGFFPFIFDRGSNDDVAIPANLNTNTEQSNANQNSAIATKTNKNSNSKTTTPATTTSSKKEAVEYLIAVGMKGDNGKGPDKVLSKWIKPSVSFQVLGSPSAESGQCVNNVVSDLNSLVDPVSFTRNDAASPADITVRFITQAELNEVYGRLGTPAPNNLHGYMTYGLNHQGSEELIYGHIYVSTDSPISEVNRCGVIRHEMTHTVGLPFNSLLHNYSIFNAGVEGHSDYIEIDKEVIRLLYNSGIPVGSNETQVRSFFGI